MLPKYDYGQAVRVIRTIRDDGTYPGKQRGDLLVKAGSVGYVRDVGTFLQDQLIYRVHFLDQEIQVGCREEELIDQNDEWIDTRFEFRQYIEAALDLSAQGETLVKKGEQGQILKVMRNHPGGPRYHVRFPGRTLQVSEQALRESAS